LKGRVVGDQALNKRLKAGERTLSTASIPDRLLVILNHNGREGCRYWQCMFDLPPPSAASYQTAPVKPANKMANARVTAASRAAASGALPMENGCRELRFRCRSALLGTKGILTYRRLAGYRAQAHGSEAMLQ
jgi:hypothetical protein